MSGGAFVNARSRPIPTDAESGEERTLLNVLESVGNLRADRLGRRRKDRPFLALVLIWHRDFIALSRTGTFVPFWHTKVPETDW